MDEVTHKLDKRDRLVVYTALFGDYDDLIDPPEKFEGCDFVCFTDQKHLKSEIWEIRLVEEFDFPPNMMNRKFKFFPNNFFSEYDVSLYLDSNISLLSSPFNLAKKVLKKHILAIPKHVRRNCIFEESKVVLERNLSKKEDVLAQMDFYQEHGMPENYGLGEMNIIFRFHNNEHVISVMYDWWEQINTFSKRDQLSFMFCAWRAGLDVGLIEETSRKPNKYFYANCHKHNSSVEKLKRYLKRLFYKFYYGY